MIDHSVRESNSVSDSGFLRNFAEPIYIATLSELVAIGLFLALSILLFAMFATAVDWLIRAQECWMSVQKENYTRKDGSRSNEATATELQAAFATAVDWLIRADGDRDHMSTSNITCEQSMAVVALLRASDAALTRLSRRVAVLESVLCNVDPDEGLNDLDKAIVEDIHHRAVERERAEANSVAGASS